MFSKVFGRERFWMVNYYDSAGNLQWGPGTTPVASFVAASAVSNGSVLAGGVVRLNHAMVVVASAGVSAGAVKLQGSLDGINWFDMPATSSVTLTTPGTSLITPPACPAAYVRAAITTLVTGGTVGVMVGSV